MKIQKGNLALEMQQKQLSADTMYVKEMSAEDVAIEGLIRKRYSMSMELALHRKKLMGTVDEDEWNEYCEYVEECIEKAREHEPIEV